MAEKKLNIPPQRTSTVVTLPSPPAKKASDYLKSYSSWVFTSVNAISQEVANIDLKLYTRKFKRGGEQVIDEVMEHEAKSLLYEVNNFMTHYQLFELTQIYLELTGEAYWVVLRDGGGAPRQLWPLRPDWVFVNPSKDDFITSYKYAPGGMADPDAIDIKIEDIIPFKYPNPVNPYRGYGSVQAAAMAIDTDVFSAEWNRNFFFNSAIPYLILRTKKKPSEAEMKRFMASWESKFQGRSNSHKIAMLTGDWEDPFVFGDKIKDMDYIEQRRMMRDEILGTFRVGKSVINLTEDVNRANAEASNLNFMERVITPKMTRFVAHLNEFYLRQNWPDQDLFFDFVDPAPADVEMNLKIYESGKNYWLTPNEIREKENLPPIEGGDVIPVPITMIPMGETGMSSDEDGTATEEAKYLYLKSSHKPQRKFKIPIPPKRLAQIKQDDTKKGIKRDMLKLVKNLMTEVLNEESEKLKKQYKGKLDWTKEQREAHWQKMVAKTDVYERRMKTDVKALFKAQREEVLGNLDKDFKHYKPERRKGKESSFLFSLIQENKKWRKVLGPLIHSVVEDKGDEVLSFLGIDSTLDLSQQVAQAFLKVEGVEFIKDVNKVTKDRLKQTLQEGLGKEEGIDQLKKRVEDVFDIATGSRAEKIARTEVLRSTNFATNEAFRQSEVVVAKEWLTAKDERVDEECAVLDGKVVELGSDFTEGSFDGEYPPLHPNCRCTILPVLR